MRRMSTHSDERHCPSATHSDHQQASNTAADVTFHYNPLNGCSFSRILRVVTVLAASLLAMIVVPARVSPPRSLPPSPVLSAAPAVVIRQAVEPVTVTATPAVTLQSATNSASPSPSHSRAHSHAHSYPAYFSPGATVVVTPAAVVNDRQYQPRLQQVAKVGVTAHTVEHSTQYVHDRPHYCDHHAPSTYKQSMAVEPHSHTSVVYAHANSPASHLVYRPPSSHSSYYQLVYDAPPAAVTHYPVVNTQPHVCSHLDAPYQQPFSMVIPQPSQPSLSPPLKPQAHRLIPTTAPLSLSHSSHSAFTPVQPIALYPHTGIMIR